MKIVQRIRAPPRVGFKLDDDTGNFDIQNKRLANLSEGIGNDDAITKHQMEVGLSTKLNPTDVLLLKVVLRSKSLLFFLRISKLCLRNTPHAKF